MKTIAFIHIPKTGGTTFSRSLHKYYRKNVCLRIDGDNYPRIDKLSTDQLLQIKLFEGHFHFGIHQHLPQQNIEYIAFIRQPLERLCSLYFYCKKKEGHYLYETINKNKITLEQFLLSDLTKELDNDQTRYISGQRHLEIGRCNNETLQLAKKNIDEHFAYVGTLEKYEESIINFQQILDTGFLYYQKKNVNKKRNYQLPENIKGEVKARNKFDYELYEYVQQKYSNVNLTNKLMFKTANFIHLNYFPGLKQRLVKSKNAFNTV